MSIEGVDFSYARPGGAALAAAGKRFVVRYITGGSGKALTAAEIADYRAHGIAIVLVFESTASRALAGRAAGAADAQAAFMPVARLHIPNSIPVYFAVDFDAQPAQQGSIDAYLRGAASVIGLDRTGVYGGINLVTRCRANGTARWFWQTYAWSGGRIAPFIHLYQYRNGQRINGGFVDLCRAYRLNYGQWPQPVAAATKLRVAITGPTRLYAKVGGSVLPNGVSLATYNAYRVPGPDGKWWYRITGTGKRNGQAFRPGRFTHAEVLS